MINCEIDTRSESNSRKAVVCRRDGSYGASSIGDQLPFRAPSNGSDFHDLNAGENLVFVFPVCVNRRCNT
jgi:hypothetical protein